MRRPKRPVGRRRIGSVVWLVALGLAWGHGLPVRAQGLPTIRILEPAPGVALFGQVVFEVGLGAEGERFDSAWIAEVLFELDGQTVARFDRPPYRAAIDVGQENRDRRFRVVVRDRLGAERVAEQLAPAIVIDETVDLGLRQIYASIETRGGRRVLDLERDDFSVWDEDRRQELVTFERGDLPLTAVLLVDGSFSMEGAPMVAATEGLRSFVSGLGPQDEAKIVLFTDRILAMSDFTAGGTPPPDLSGFVADGGSAVNDHLYLALQWLESRQGRRVVLLLSDGLDNHSVLRSAQVREVAQRAQALIYWARLEKDGRLRQVRPVGPGRRLVYTPTEPGSAWRERDEAQRERDELGRLVRGSGGRIVTLGRSEEIAGSYEEILRELREQYVLGYYPDPTDRDGRWREVRIEVEGHRGLEIRCREGYYDF